MQKAITLRAATTSDAPAINALLKQYSAQEVLLARTEQDIIRFTPNFQVAVVDQELVGCVSLEIFNAELGEIRSLAVDTHFHGRSIGQKLVKACEQQAHDIGLSRMMALTYVDNFFEKLGYTVVNRDLFPEKVWRVCVQCPKFNHCDEIAVLKYLPETL